MTLDQRLEAGQEAVPQSHRSPLPLTHRALHEEEAAAKMGKIKKYSF